MLRAGRPHPQSDGRCGNRSRRGNGFRFFDNRDLLGFVDGTENPGGPIAISATAIGDEDPDFAGSCYVHVQKYVHDMQSWDSLSVTDRNG